MQFIGGCDPVKDDVYHAMDNYFDHPEMIYTETKDNLNIYICRLHSYLMNEHRFLIAMTLSSPFTLPPASKVPLQDLKWKSFQIRKLEDYEKYLSLPQHHYTSKPNSIFGKQTVQAVHSSRVYTEYNTGIPSLLLHLLHVRNSFHEYAIQGTFSTAMETFQALFIWKEEQEGKQDQNETTLSSTQKRTSNIPETSNTSFPTFSSISSISSPSKSFSTSPILRE
uniref:Uncharacterized protein n=1 Tax=viral metagenome TaxID=1070528 RepID=A0A6C0D1X6_9ZZZZ